MHVSWRKRVSRALRGKLRSLALSKHGLGVVAETKNGVLVVDPRDFGVSSSLLSRGDYDWEGVSWLLSLVDRESHLVFVGAHLGALLVPVAAHSGARKIVAFEPVPNTYRLLTLNVALNGLAGVTVHQQAIGDTEGSVRFTQNPINTGNSRVSNTGEIVVPVSTLDAALKREAWGHTDLLVLDTEGFEARAMRGASHTLAQTRYFYVEYSPEQLREQGSTPEEFLELAASHFQSMYVQSSGQFFPAKTYTQYLRDLPERRGLLMNLLFSNDPRPNARLSAARAPHGP
jgi:FkbM family methyltransferase